MEAQPVISKKRCFESPIKLIEKSNKHQKLDESKNNNEIPQDKIINEQLRENVNMNLSSLKDDKETPSPQKETTEVKEETRGSPKIVMEQPSAFICAAILPGIGTFPDSSDDDDSDSSEDLELDPKYNPLTGKKILE